MGWIESVRFGETMRKVAGATEDAAEGIRAWQEKRKPPGGDADDGPGPPMTGRPEYERIRAAHLDAVQATLDDHVSRLDWSAEQIRRHRDQGLRSLLAYARERSPFYADRLRGLDVERATTADLASIPMLTKAEAQDGWDAIVTTPDLDREAAERILNEQTWFSYTRHDEQVFSSGGSSGVRGVYVWDWQFFITTACLADACRRVTNGAARRRRMPRLAVLTAGVPPHASTPLFDVPTAAGMQTVVIEAGAPFDEVLAAVDEHAPDPPRGLCQRRRPACARLIGRRSANPAVPGEHELRTAAHPRIATR